MKIAFIGTGTAANKLAARWAEAGHEIVFGSREPEGKESPYPVHSHADAVADAEVVVNAVPGTAALDTFTAVGDEALAGKILLDIANAITAKGELLYPNGSLGQELQAALPSARVVKTANTAYIGLIAKPEGYADAGMLFISGDDPDAKAVVRGLFRDLGWTDEQLLELGGIDTARAAEHYFLLFMSLLRVSGGPRFNVRIVG